MTKKTYTLTDSDFKKKALVNQEERLKMIKARLEHRARMKTDEAKIDAVKTYIALGGNLTLTAATVGISRNTLKSWKTTTWWARLTKEFRSEEKLKLSASTKAVINKAMEELADRLENGDHLYDSKRGFFVRKPVAAKELHRISVEMMDKADKIDRQIDHGEDDSPDQTQEDKLQKIAEQFAQLAMKAIKKPTQVTDVIFIEEKK